MASVDDIMAKIKSMQEDLKTLEKDLRVILKGASSTKVSKAKKAAKAEGSSSDSEKVTRAPTAWTAWTKHAKSAFPADYETFAENAESKRGIAIVFAKHASLNHADEFAEFNAAFSVAHPKTDVKPKSKAKAKAKEDTSSLPPFVEDPPALTGKEVHAPKKKVLLIKKPNAAKPEMIPATIRGKIYTRNAETNGCWRVKADGSRGEWAGVYDPITDTLEACDEQS